MPAAIIERIEEHAVQAWLEIGRLTAGEGFRAEPFEGGVAIRWDRVPAPLFNRLMAAGRHGTLDVNAVSRLCREYEAAGLPFSIQVSSTTQDPSLRPALAEVGFELRDRWSVLAATPETWIEPAPPADVEVQQIDDDQREAIAGILLAAFGMPESMMPWIRLLIEAPMVTNFIARIDGQPAGCGQIFRAAGVAGLYSGGVLEAFRRRGGHRALIAARVRSAFDAGHDLVMSETEAESNQSNRDLTAQGFQLAYLRENWVRTPSSDGR